MSLSNSSSLIVLSIKQDSRFTIFYYTKITKYNNMPLIICSDCNKSMSDAADKCPHCGGPNRSEKYRNDKITQGIRENIYKQNENRPMARLYRFMGLRP